MHLLVQSTNVSNTPKKKKRKKRKLHNLTRPCRGFLEPKSRVMRREDSAEVKCQRIEVALLEKPPLPRRFLGSKAETTYCQRHHVPCTAHAQDLNCPAS
ncbi:Inactive poly [ADP-ribose] polymerase SRO2 [Actinidia chinensis var. chinensis]|uniref:Inactive poly [ADP-ribose] polymerase SRO2 n=1 Tax=Actinidia chinensis var. chinensis TaxID=1590841 RepID=A0A2R6Q9Q2_ACTCC|nr:Inactive poly [ADP-ribose] polymerase SRO2 [Actinidia chinensis var. chinensis]